MSDGLITIDAELRTLSGKGSNRKLRSVGRIPGVILDGGKATSISLDPKWLSRAYKSEGSKFNLNLGGKTSTVFIKELQIDPVKRTAKHVDLMYVK